MGEAFTKQWNINKKRPRMEPSSMLSGCAEKCIRVGLKGLNIMQMTLWRWQSFALTKYNQCHTNNTKKKNLVYFIDFYEIYQCN